MYDELVEALRRMANTWLAEEYKVCAEAVRILTREAANAIGELQEDNAALNGTVSNLIEQIAELGKQKWIPVTERLPEVPDDETISKDVYVTDGTEIAKACIMRDYEGVTGWTYTGIGEITHWCEQIPLPQPPRGE